MKRVYSLVILFSAVLPIFAFYTHAESLKCTDGIYEGEHWFIKVRVTVEKGNISDIEILHHGGGGKKYESMVEPLTNRIIENQSTKVDGVTGAAVSSVNLKKAVEDALQGEEKE